MNERLRIRYTKAGLRRTFPDGIVDCILAGTSWKESCATATELGECSELIAAQAIEDSRDGDNESEAEASNVQQWQKWLTEQVHDQQTENS